jgi:hypothetical protein
MPSPETSQGRCGAWWATLVIGRYVRPSAVVNGGDRFQGGDRRAIALVSLLPMQPHATAPSRHFPATASRRFTPLLASSLAYKSHEPCSREHTHTLSLAANMARPLPTSYAMLGHQVPHRHRRNQLCRHQMTMTTRSTRLFDDMVEEEVVVRRH